MREGLIPTVLGVGVTAAGMSMKAASLKSKMKTDFGMMVACGVVGFGLAHVVLGGIDLVQEMRK